MIEIKQAKQRLQQDYMISELDEKLAQIDLMDISDHRKRYMKHQINLQKKQMAKQTKGEALKQLISEESTFGIGY